MEESNQLNNLLAHSNKLLEEIASSNEALVVLLMRLYDVNMALLHAQSPYAAEKLVEYHEQGRTVTGPPSYVVEEDN